MAPRTASPVEDDEELAQGFTDDDETEEEDDDEEIEADSSSLEAFEARLQKTVAKRIATYLQNQEARFKKFQEKQDSWRQRRVDEYALKTAGDGNVALANPEAVAQSIERQVAAVEARLAELQAMRQRLAAAQGGSEGEIAS